MVGVRIAFVTQWFAPEPAAILPVGIADGLASRGHHVDVVTGFPNYPTGIVHAGYPIRRYRRDERGDRVVVHRAPLYPSHDTSAVRRSANYVSFALSAVWLARTRLPRPDAWLIYSSPATAALPALTVPRRLRAPTHLLIIDLWPDSVMDSGFVGGRVGHGMERALSAYCRRTYRAAASLGIPSAGMHDVLVSRGADPARIRYTPNWAEDDHLLPAVAPTDALRRSLGLPSGRLFMYAGNLGRLQGLDTLLEAFERCPEANLALVGDGIAKSELQDLVRRRRMSNVHFFGYQAPELVGRFIAASDVQVISLKDTPLLRVTTPSKVQAAMAAARPILVHACGDVAELVLRHGAGAVAHPGDVSATADQIRRLHRSDNSELVEMGRRARACYEAEFTPAAALDRIEAMLVGAAPGAMGPDPLVTRKGEAGRMNSIPGPRQAPRRSRESRPASG